MDKIRVALVGAGSFVQAVHIPNFLKREDRFRIRAVVTRSQATAERVGAMIPVDYYAVQDYDRVLGDPEVDLVFIATRHNLHTDQVLRALESGKAVFCEKPLTLDPAEALRIVKTARAHDTDVMVGLNRRSAPIVQKMHAALADVPHPWLVNYYWANKPWGVGWPFDPVEGGGKTFSCGGHGLDMLSYLIGSPAVRVYASGGNRVYPEIKTDDTATIVVDYADGTTAAVQLVEMGADDFPQERLTVCTTEGVAVLDNYQTLRLHGLAGDDVEAPEMDKGLLQELDDLYAFCQGIAPAPAGALDGYRACLLCDAAVRSMRTGQPVVLESHNSVKSR